MQRGYRTRWAVGALVSVMLALSSWALSSPIGSSPDDDFHLPSIWCAQGVIEEVCEPGKDNPSIYAVPETLSNNSFCFAFNPANSGLCPYSTDLSETSRVNATAGLYPPVYYWTMSWFVSEDLNFAVMVMRLVNIAIAVIVVTLLIVALPIHLRRIPVISLLGTVIPLGVFIVSSTNPSGLAYVGLVVFFSALVGFFSVSEIRERWSLGLIALIGFLLAGGSRGDVAIFSIVAIAAAVILKAPGKKLRALTFSTMVLLAALAVFFYWRSAGPDVVGAGAMRLAPEGSIAPSFLANVFRLPELYTGVFGTYGLGWLDTSMQPVVWVSALSVFVAVIFSAIRWFSKRQMLVFTFISLSLVVFPMYVLTVNSLEVGQNVQPRYLLPLIALLLAVSLVRESVHEGLRFSTVQVWILGALLVVANTVALNTNIRRYISGLDIKSVNLDFAIEWWWEDFPFSPQFVWIVGSLSFALFLVSLWKLRETLGLPGTDPSPRNKKFAGSSSNGV
jgi:hypothetical protein